jgi:hypothetical protein
VAAVVPALGEGADCGCELFDEGSASDRLADDDDAEEHLDQLSQEHEVSRSVFKESALQVLERSFAYCWDRETKELRLALPNSVEQMLADDSLTREYRAA